MLYPITCSCGRSLGDLADAYKLMRYKRIQSEVVGEAHNISPDMLAIVDDLSPEMREDFEQLGLDMECCITKMKTSVEFWELY